MLKKIRFIDAYYFLVFIGYILMISVSAMRPGALATLLMIIIAGETLLREYKDCNDQKINIITILGTATLIDVVVAVYFVYNCFSVIWLLKYGLPVSVFSGEFVCSVLPIVFYFAAVAKQGNRDSFYKAFAYAFAFLGIVSLVLYLLAPQFYCDFLFRMSLISKADAATAQVRMESVTGSTSFTFLANAGMVIASYFLVKAVKEDSKTKKEKILITVSVAGFLFSLILTFLANSRAGMVTAILLIIYLNVLAVFAFKVIPKKYFFIEIGVALAGLIGLLIVAPSIISKIAARLVSLPGAVGQRSEQWVAAMNNMHGAWLGNGLGANGHRVYWLAQEDPSLHPIADGGIFKLFCEEGCIGFGLFVYILLVILIKGIKNIDKMFAEVAIISIALLLSIGANVIAFQLCTPLFWYAIGIISKNIRDEKDLFSYSVKNRMVLDKE